MSEPIAHVIYKDRDGILQHKPIYVDMEIQMIRIGEDVDVGCGFGYIITGNNLEIEGI